MSRTFRIRVDWPDGGGDTFEVIAVNVTAYGDEPLEMHTEFGLTIQVPEAPDDHKEDADARP
jgi:hypothetical protein